MSISLKELAARFSMASTRVDDVSNTHLRTFAVIGVGFVKQEIQGMHAVDTGAMLNSTTVEQAGAHTYLIGPTVNYAPYVALGTSRMPARPFHIEAAKKLNDKRRAHWRRYKEGLGL